MSKKGSSSSDENLDLHNWYDNDQYLERRDINDTADNTSDSAQRENVNLLTRVALSIVGDDPNSQDPNLRQATDKVAGDDDLKLDEASTTLIDNVGAEINNMTRDIAPDPFYRRMIQKIENHIKKKDDIEGMVYNGLTLFFGIIKHQTKQRQQVDDIKAFITQVNLN